MPPQRFPWQCARALITLLFTLHTGTAQAECRMVEMGRFPVNLSGNQIHIKGLLNGTAVNILMDTGAIESMIIQGAAERAGLKPVKDRRYQMVGVSGKTEVYRTRVDELIIGNFPVRNRVWPVIAASGALADVGMILGADFWTKVDFEINLAARELILWDNQECAKAPLAYWNKDFMLAVLAPKDDKIRVDAVVSGQKIRAMIDTGASVSFIDRRVADRIGYRTDADGEGKQQVSGIGKRGALDTNLGVFESFTLGDLTVNNARLRIIEMEENTQETGARAGGSIIDFDNLIIGADFLLANHVMIANSQGYLYMTYNGGPVFQTGATDSPEGKAVAAGGIRGVSELLPETMSETWVNALAAQGKGDDALTETLFRAVLDELRADGKADTRDALIPLNGLASALVRQKKFAEAKTILLQLQDRLDQLLGPAHQLAASNLQTLGEVQVALHEYDAAVKTLEQALSIAEAIHGQEGLGTAEMLAKLGLAVEAAGDYERAGKIFARELAIREKHAGTGHPDTASAMINVGRMEESQERYADAISTYQRAREIFAAQAGNEDMLKYLDEYIAHAREAAAP